MRSSAPANKSAFQSCSRLTCYAETEDTTIAPAIFYAFDWALLSWEKIPMAVEETTMEAQATDMDQMIPQLNELIIPSTLMESFDAYREDTVRASAQQFSKAQLI